MKSGSKPLRVLKFLAVCLLQLIMTQVVTFVLSLFLPDVENFQQTRAALFALLVGLAFALGTFATGWLALKLRWLAGKPRLPARLVLTLCGVTIPLFTAVLVYGSIEAGNPFFLISIVAGILGFHVPGIDKGHVIA